MSTNGETADLMVREGIQITESALKLAGLGAKNLAALLIALANDNQKLAGKTNLKRLIHDGEELTIFSVKQEDLKGFQMEAKRYWTAAGAAVLCLCCATPAMAAGSDPLDIVNNLSDFIFSIIKALGVIILGWGIVQVGMSIQSHDASQRTQGFLCLFGGLMIAFAKEILTAIGAI